MSDAAQENALEDEAPTNIKESSSINTGLKACMTGLLPVALLGALPLLALLTLDFWYRTDFVFFPMLILAPIILMLLGKPAAGNVSSARDYWAMGLLVVSAVLLILATWYLSAWLGILGLIGAIIGTLLHLSGRNAWYQIVGWCIPLALLLVLPTSDARHLAEPLGAIVCESSGAILDLIAIPNVAGEDRLDLGTSLVSSRRLFRSWGSPYLLLVCGVLSFIFVRCRPLASLLCICTIPLWAWGWGTVVMTLAAYLLVEYQEAILVGRRLLGVQFAFQVVSLASIAGTYSLLANLLAPFSNYSSTSSGIHKFFNKAVYWPASDPLRARRTEKRRKDHANSPFFSGHTKWVSPLLLLLFVASAGLGWYRLSKVGLDTLRPMQVTSTALQGYLVADTLPETLRDLRQVDFSVIPVHVRPGQFQAVWVYANAVEKLEIVAELPIRGGLAAPLGAKTVVAQASLEGELEPDIVQDNATDESLAAIKPSDENVPASVAGESNDALSTESSALPQTPPVSAPLNAAAVDLSAILAGAGLSLQRSEVYELPDSMNQRALMVRKSIRPLTGISEEESLGDFSLQPTIATVTLRASSMTPTELELRTTEVIRALLPPLKTLFNKNPRK